MIRLCDGFAHASEIAGVPLPAHFEPARFRQQWLPLVDESETGRINQTAFCARSAALFGMTDEHLLAICDAWLVEPFDGVGELLDDLRDRQIATACLSNTNDGHWAIMHDPAGPYAANMGRLDHRFASHELGLRKPDAAIHRAVEQRTGCDAGAIVFFDDSAANIAGAAACGWRAFQIDPLDDPARQMRRYLRALGVL